MPNYFAFNGPNAPVGAGSLVPATEAQGDYILKVSLGFAVLASLPDFSCRISDLTDSLQAVNKLQKQNLKSMVPKEECVTDFVNHVRYSSSLYLHLLIFSTMSD